MLRASQKAREASSRSEACLICATVNLRTSSFILSGEGNSETVTLALVLPVTPAAYPFLLKQPERRGSDDIFGAVRRTRTKTVASRIRGQINVFDIPVAVHRLCL